jgi:hypothetical protein
VGLLLAVAVALAAAALTTGVSPAEAKTPCGNQVIQDWYDDGRLDKRYSPKCLNDARKRIPDDLEQYSSLDDEILRQRRSTGRTLAVGRGSPRRQSGGPTIDEPSDGLFRQAFSKTNPRNADSLPLPLLILGGLALLLMSAGAAGLVTRRLRARRARA